MHSTEINDWSLLREYVERHSEAAFETVVRRHLDMVYSAAWRQVADSDIAEDVTQAVFVLLARKAPQLREGIVIAGWLYRSACLTARRSLRDQTRRRIKDREAAEMKSTDTNDEIWNRLMPHLDPALAKLDEEDRTAIVLRFLERRNFRDVAATLNVSEDAAKKRVVRALEKLRLHFTRQGVALGLTAIVVALTARASETAPAGLLTASVRAGLSGGAAAGSGVGSLVSGMAREARLLQLKWAVALAGAGILLTLIGATLWPSPKSSSPPTPKFTMAGTRGESVTGKPLVPLPKAPAVAADSADRRAMTLHVVADETGEPLAGLPVYAEFVIIPKSVPATFRTDRHGDARIVLPSELVNSLSLWVSTPGRVPMSVIYWNLRAAGESLPPEYVLRLPLGRFVAGVVVDEKGEPVAGATVQFQSAGMVADSREYVDYGGPDSVPPGDRPVLPVTDAFGRWSANFISPQAESVYGYLEHPDFATTQFGHIQPPEPVVPSTNLVLVLQRGVSVTGFVRDSAGQPIPQAYVDLHGLFRRVPFFGRTDAEGFFEFPHIEAGELFLDVDAKGFESRQRMAVDGRRATNFNIVLTAIPVGGNTTIRGRLTAPDGTPIAGVGASVTPGQPGLEEIHWGMLTDAEGRFAWITAPDYAVKLRVGGSSLDWEKQDVLLAPDGTESVIVLKPRTKIRLHGTVADQSNGHPLPEFKVLHASGHKQGYVVNPLLLTEGRDGKFATTLLPEQVRNYPAPGTGARLNFQAPGYVNKIVLLTGGTNDLDLAVQLEPAMDIAGVVLRPDGNPAAGAHAFFHGDHFRFRVGGDCLVGLAEYPFPVDTRTGNDGAFHIPKIDGIDRLEVVHPDGWADVPLDAASTAVIRLQPWARITGVVRSGAEVLAGAMVRASEAADDPDQMLFGLSTKTDAEGHFDFSQVPGGRARIFLPQTRDDQGTNGPAWEILVESGRTTNLTLSLPR